MDVSRQGMSTEAGVPRTEALPKKVEGKNGASAGGKEVSACNPGISLLQHDGAVPGLALATSPVGSRKAEALSGGLPETEVLKPLDLKCYEDSEEALQSLLELELCKSDEMLGKGTWGSVYRAVSPVLNARFVAAKFNSESDKNECALQANPNKYDVAALLLPEHPHVMKNHSVLVGSKQDTDFYGIISHPDQLPPGATESLYIAAVVSEFANGKGLSEIINKYTVGREHLIVIAQQLAGALAHMHEHGFAHRDVSTKNVLYHPEYGLKLIDMGSVIKTTERAESYVGTTQLLKIDGFDPSGANKIFGFNYDTKALDSWELGCVLFYCLTGNYVNYYQPDIDGFNFTDDDLLSSACVTKFAHKTDSRKEAIIRKHLKPGLRQSGIDPEFLNIVTGLLKAGPAERLSVEEAKKRLDKLQVNR